jgi:hypothetical protein
MPAAQFMLGGMASSGDDYLIVIEDADDGANREDPFQHPARPRRPAARWVWLVAAVAFVAGDAIGWSAAHRSNSVLPAVAPSRSVPSAQAGAPVPVGCPDGSKVFALDVTGPNAVAAAFRTEFPTFVVIGGTRGFSGFTGALCGATLTGRDPSGVTVEVTLAQGLARQPSQVIRLEQNGPNVRAELVRVTAEGQLIDVLVFGPTGERAPTIAMRALANDPRLVHD